ncbi:MAG: 30S ribosomal protein S20 [Thermodesulfobacteriota bacterium]|nr:30S ribosomal protein S20 [Thermodesulfobacteriota bacterium]
MANHKSAIKRHRQSKIRELRNKSRKTTVKTMTKKIEAAVKNNAAEDARAQLKAAQKLIDKTAAKGTLHRNTAARKISRLTRMVSSIG